MRVVMLSKALLAGAYQRKAEEIARQGVDLTVLIPPFWQDRRGLQQAELLHTEGYALRVIPLRLAGNYHLHYYPTLGRELDRLCPQVVHVDEEPYNLATWLAVHAARRAGAAPTFFTWQNLRRRYPPPFRWMEWDNYRACAVAMAGTQTAATVLRWKGYKGRMAVIPQFGVDPDIFAPADAARGEGSEPCAGSVLPPPGAGPAGFHIGYAGGLIPEKGIDLLLRACAQLCGEWRLSLVGSGEEVEVLRALAHSLGIGERTAIGCRLASHEMPAFYRSLDVLVLPSRSRANWQEQFGRVLIEAMACGVPVIGSTCGEIPHVIGEAGLLFPEGDPEALRQYLQRLLADPGERRRLAQAGRRRVLAHYTMRQVAEETVRVYRSMMRGANQFMIDD